MTDLQKQAAEVVGRLTHRQKEALLGQPVPGSEKPRMVAAGLLRLEPRPKKYSTKNQRYLYALTELGAAVRALLQDNPHARDNEEMSDG